MTKEQIIESPVFVIEEDEEEDFTLDFDTNTAYQKEEHIIINSNLDVDVTIKPEQVTTVESIAVQAPAPTFKNEMQDLLVNTITSKAIGSLMKKRLELDNEIDDLLQKQKIGDLKGILSNEIGTALYDRKIELRNCFLGTEVRYERIPEWAKSYIKEYTKDMIHDLTVLMND